MIATITLNPSLDYVAHTAGDCVGSVIRTKDEVIYPGGKGINVSIVLNRLGVTSKALGFCAGFTGEELCRLLEHEGCPSALIPLKNGFTRINVKVTGNQETELNGSGPIIDEEAFQCLIQQVSLMKQDDFLVIAGSIPSSLSSGTYTQLLTIASQQGIETVVDVSGELLFDSLSYHPFLIKPNHHELGALFHVTIETKDEAVFYAKQLQEKGARNVLISMAEQGAVLVTESGETFFAQAPTGTLVYSVGAGDSMVAGFLAGWLQTKSFSHALKLGICAGSATAFSSWLATKEEIESLYYSHEKQQ